MVPLRHRSALAPAFTLVEMLVVVAILAILLVFLNPVIASMLRRAELARDTSNLRSYGMAVTSMSSELQFVSANDILRSGSTVIDTYAGGSSKALAMMNSRLWTKMNQATAAAAGKTVGKNTRSYTLNESLFPPKTAVPGDPPPAPWDLDPLSSARLGSFSARPLLFSGVYLSGHNGAYIWGSRNHANPIYSGTNKTSPTGAIHGDTLVLFVGGHARIVDFSTENVPPGPSQPDPLGWFVRVAQ